MNSTVRSCSALPQRAAYHGEDIATLVHSDCTARALVNMTGITYAVAFDEIGANVMSRRNRADFGIGTGAHPTEYGPVYEAHGLVKVPMHIVRDLGTTVKRIAKCIPNAILVNKNHALCVRNGFIVDTFDGSRKHVNLDVWVRKSDCVDTDTGTNYGFSRAIDHTHARKVHADEPMYNVDPIGSPQRVKRGSKIDWIIWYAGGDGCRWTTLEQIFVKRNGGRWDRSSIDTVFRYDLPRKGYGISTDMSDGRPWYTLKRHA